MSKIKSYKLNPKVNKWILKRAGFAQNGLEEYTITYKLWEDIDLLIHIDLLKKSSWPEMTEDDFMLVIDTASNGYNMNYIPFYTHRDNGRPLFPYLSNVIKNYETRMDTLVKQRILKEVL